MTDAMKKLFLTSWLLVVVVLAYPVGQWTEYLSYASAQKVIRVGNVIYCVTTGGLFSFDTSDNSIQKLNMVGGLSDVGVSTVAYSDETDLLIVAYSNGNVDLVSPRQVYNMADIKRKQMSGDKTIYSILVVGKTAYLSCGFGIVALNLEKREVKDTYYIGDNASQIRVNDMCYDGNSLFAATEAGVFRADINSDNLLDYKNWEWQSSLPNATGEYSHAVVVEGEAMVSYSGSGWWNDAVYRFDGSGWNRFPGSFSKVTDMTVDTGKLLISSEERFDVYDEFGQLLTRLENYQLGNLAVNGISPRSAVTDSDGNYWIADNRYALLHSVPSGFEQAVPQGPASNRVFSLLTNGADLWLTDGGRTADWNNRFYNPRIQRYRNSEWTWFDDSTNEAFNGLHDAVCVAVDPADSDHWFAGLWGGGVFEFRGNQLRERYTNSNSSLQTALPSQSAEPYVRISGMQFDSKGNLWITNTGVGQPLSVFTVSGEWKSYVLPGIQTSNDIGPLVISDSDDVWMTVPRNQNKLIIRKADGTQTRNLTVTAFYSNGTDEVSTPMTDIYCIAKDREGEIWIGTAVGVGVYAQPDELWASNTFYASQPGLDEGDGLYHPLLSKQTVTAIAVDGANRKWLGTKSSGLYLVSEDGTEELLHFTIDDSPLLSNEITSLAIADKTGEVFIGTAKGLISYMGTAIEGADNYNSVYAYPNPVRENYFGDIVITGLMEDTDIKITDISGNLVFKTKSTGGQAVWDGKTLRGNRASTGVYLVFGNDKYGKENFVTKILFIH